MAVHFSLTIFIDIQLLDFIERQNSSQKLRQDLSEIIKHIIRVVNDNDLHMPKEPGEKDHDCVYDTSIPDMQPYLFRVISTLLALCPVSDLQYFFCIICIRSVSCYSGEALQL